MRARAGGGCACDRGVSRSYHVDLRCALSRAEKYGGIPLEKTVLFTSDLLLQNGDIRVCRGDLIRGHYDRL